MDSADLTFNDIKISLDLLKHRSGCLSQKVDSRLEGTLRPAMDQKMYTRLMITDLLNLSLISEDCELPTTLPIPDPFPFKTLYSLLFHRLLLVWRAFCPFVSLYACDSLALLQNPSATPALLPGSFCPSDHAQKLSLTPFLRVADNRLYRLRNTGR